MTCASWCSRRSSDPANDAPASTITRSSLSCGYEVGAIDTEEMMRAGIRTLIAALAALSLALPAAAHPNHVDGTTDLTAGVSHPFTGVDHLAAMLAVGLLA